MSRSRFWRGRRRERIEAYGANGSLASRTSDDHRDDAGASADDGSELSDGVVVETQLLARVLGVRLLRVDGTVLCRPAAGRAAWPLRRRDGPPVPSRLAAPWVRGRPGHLLAQAAPAPPGERGPLRRLR